MDSSKVNACTPRSVRVRLAKPEDAERIKIVINSAFRRVEEFFIDQDRVDVESVLNFIETGKFLLAEGEGTLRGCVYVEPRPLPVSQESPDSTDRTPDDPAKENSDLTGTIRISQSEIRNSKFSRAYLGLLAVDPVHQQSGLGSLLMDAAEDYCRGLGAGFMDLKVVSLRQELFGFYRRRGYVETGASPFPEDVKTKLPCHLIDMSKSLHQDKEW
jgi:GNAT superfamily N-acetyltransferase